MNPEHKKKIQEGRYKHLYGDNWKEVLEERKAHPVTSPTRELRQVRSPHALGKKEFLDMLVERLRNKDTSDSCFALLVGLYVDIRQWSGPRTKASARVKVAPVQEGSRQAGPREDAINELVLKLEQEKKSPKKE